MSLPNANRPCRDCPFRKDSLKGWLGKERMTRILDSASFACHKTLKTKRLQCAGHMLIKGEENTFVQLAQRMGLELSLNGQENVFETKQACIEHHSINPAVI